MTDPKTTPAQGSAPAQTTPSTTPSAPASESAPPADPTKAAVLQGLTIAASIATGIAALPIPYAQTIAAVVAGLLAVTRGIVERWGMQGLGEAKKLLEELHARGPAVITDAELAADDAALLAEIHGWYPAQAAVVDERIARAGVLPPNPYPAKPYPLIKGEVPPPVEKMDEALAPPRVRAKFVCTVANESEYGVGVRLDAVTADNANNESWSRWTPSGHIEMLITNPSASGIFVDGEEYFLDFTPVKG